MSNFQRKFEKWQEKMGRKSPEEKHNLAVLWASIITFFVAFIVVSNWYLKLTGENWGGNMFVDVEKFYRENIIKFLPKDEETEESKNIDNI